MAREPRFTKHTSIQLEPEMHEAVKEVAHKERIAIADVYRMFVADGLKKMSEAHE